MLYWLEPRILITWHTAWNASPANSDETFCPGYPSRVFASHLVKRCLCICTIEAARFSFCLATQVFAPAKPVEVTLAEEGQIGQVSFNRRRPERGPLGKALPSTAHIRRPEQGANFRSASKIDRYVSREWCLKHLRIASGLL